ncbi:hypothetical protein predicted by Glimmer/Critica [Sorangium cellulosum So ce56]|uniref:Secreted protein n=1 Tax=Sorangium cellulosum (strain So ce56) TaxID=448385 RepID=A9GM35_SORC5|nr:hypothetical protein [Sorangium cellulosum]CAN90366.1 hypothetical protein predicted by Glimmer/Critica [Sorangium cellulosum So ce56]
MKSVSGVFSAVIVTTLLALSACGGSVDDEGNSKEEGPSCGLVAACGGDPTGSWTMDETCLDPSMFEDLNKGCDGEIDISGMVVSGRAEFRADNTYVTTITHQGPIKAVYPAACLAAEDIPITCAQLSVKMQRAAAGKESPLTSAECAHAGADCACTFVFGRITTPSTGTWSVSGSILTLEPEGAEPEENPFCAQGSSFTRGFPVSAGGDASGPIRHYMRFTKE